MHLVRFLGIDCRARRLGPDSWAVQGLQHRKASLQTLPLRMCMHGEHLAFLRLCCMYGHLAQFCRPVMC